MVTGYVVSQDGTREISAAEVDYWARQIAHVGHETDRK